ncbi:MAG: HAD family phosphatase [Ignavibacteriales bacterium]|nr:HAD family phosphatase [Ignavibacteriales bacterium]
MNIPKIVLFDLGNVLVHIHPEAMLQSLGIDTPENRERFALSIIDIVRRYECGDESTEQFLGRLETLLNKTGEFQTRPNGFSQEKLQQAMLTIIGKPIEGMEEIVKQVATRIPVALLSNTNPLHYELCRQNLPVLQWIPKHFLSYRLGALKPEREIYEKMVRAVGLPPSDILFIDDAEKNLLGAQKIGISTLLFQGSEKLERRLGEMGLVLRQ